ncbi:PREDICTED: multiple coagulation factor deficiency protein 2-like isoform X2 [Nicrophorus vespilloides]|uniref:Multiple coagulation factor deficiency protein 2-like isoform X2 n=1 Tax=Nicrophorus vespilloides TaxID=110193 RepID=A0ABM1NA04_NICVS|nr:PREDICTED: multiple coagulation factor deficiency protein 2-like isoform X2 [Nicrophorus vespilloides]
MWLIFLSLAVFLLSGSDVVAQRVVPGVNPQHYQQPPPPQYQQQQQQPQYQQQQQQQQFQQVPIQQTQQQVHQQQVQHQQVPVQHQQQHVPQQQQQGHHHAHAMPQPGQILNAANIVQEKEHIAEHMEVPIDTSKMTDQELQFHYFKMHDADNNNKLDGCELIKSLIHWHGPGDGPQPSMSDGEFAEIIDPLLGKLDENNDGYVEYSEYKRHSAL